MANGRTISNADRARAAMIMDESGRTMPTLRLASKSNADRARAAMLMGEGDRARTISNADRARAAMIMGEGARAGSDADRMLLRYLRDNDGGSSKSPRDVKLR